MNFSIYLCSGVATFIFFLGIYVFRIQERKKIQSVFLLLCTLMSTWIFAFAFRDFVSLQYKHLALDWMLIPTIFFPILLDQIVSLISDSNYKFQNWKKGILSGIVAYFIWAACTCSYSVIGDIEKFTYSSTIHYHFLIGYITVYTSYSIVRLMRSIFQSSGGQRVRAMLMATGIFVSLSFAIIFIYLLPLFGIFHGYLTSIGVLISIVLWAVAILQYDAFEMKLAIISGQKVPLLYRISLNPFLLIFSLIDPFEFRNRNFQMKASFATDFLYTDLNLRLNTDLSHRRRAEVLATKYERYIK